MKIKALILVTFILCTALNVFASLTSAEILKKHKSMTVQFFLGEIKRVTATKEILKWCSNKLDYECSVTVGSYKSIYEHPAEFRFSNKESNFSQRIYLNSDGKTATLVLKDLIPEKILSQLDYFYQIEIYVTPREGLIDSGCYYHFSTKSYKEYTYALDKQCISYDYAEEFFGKEQTCEFDTPDHWLPYRRGFFEQGSTPALIRGVGWCTGLQ